MKKLFYSAFAYMVIGVLSGLFYREFTKGKQFDGFTQLSVVHTHLLTLGFIVLLIVLILEKLFTLSKSRLFNWFFWPYNAGLILSAAIMVVHGMLQVNGTTDVSAAIPGIAGLGHILLSAGMVFMFLALRTRLFAPAVKVPTVKHDDGTPVALAG
ncbi:DUF2871 domain-containing protein [Specibacter sp. NPDC078692]|uniref:DUF2871 domain-containing protein n=1 Tax=Specibacter sp. NPDC078692 TaxID=3155818 RepID=UPI0034400A0E